MKETVHFYESRWQRIHRIALTALHWRRKGHTILQLCNLVQTKLSARCLSDRPMAKPYMLLVEPTNACNLQCPLCPTGRRTLGRPTGMMDMQVYRSLIFQSKHWASQIFLSNYGEPLLHPAITEMVQLAKESGMEVAMASNMHALQADAMADQLIAAGLDFINVSFDGVNQETFQDYRRNGRFEVLVSAVKRLVAAKRRMGSRTPFIELQYIVMRHNESCIDEFRRMADGLGVDGISLKAMSFNNADWGDTEVLSEFRKRYPGNKCFHLYDVEPTAIRWKPGKAKSVCKAPWFTLTILWDGSIVPCCLDPRGELVLGCVQDGILDAWCGSAAQSLRKALASRRGLPDLCSNCLGL
jgi:MoaA/NifB/PqqE/SkfB family radical SAM enzyme